MVSVARSEALDWNASNPGEVAQVRIEGRRLVVGGTGRPVEPRIIALLRTLAGAGGAVVSRDELLDRCWGDEGSDEALTQAVTQLRRALGDNPRAPCYIETAPKRGYVWLGGPVVEGSAPRPVGSVTPATPQRLVLVAVVSAAAVGAIVAATVLWAGRTLFPAPQPHLEYHFILKSPPPAEAHSQTTP